MSESFAELSGSGIKREPLRDAVFTFQVMLERRDFLDIEIAGCERDFQTFATNVIGSVFDLLENESGASSSALTISPLTGEEIE